MSEIAHIFSQDGELSQLTCPITRSNTENCFQNDAQNENNDIPDYSEDYSNHESVTTQNPEEPLSSRANAICEQNRHIRQFIESGLKKLEKKRLKLVDEERKIDEQLMLYSGIHERQSQQSIDLQMQLEEWTEKYQSQINERPQLIDKINYSLQITDLLKKNVAEGRTHVKDLLEAEQILKTQSEENYGKLKEIAFKKHNMLLMTVNKLQEKTDDCQKLRENIMEEKEKSMNEVQTLAVQNFEKSKRVNNLLEMIKENTTAKKNLTKKYDDLCFSVQNKNEEIERLQQQLSEVSTANTLKIQNLKFQIETEENRNQVRETSLKEKEDTLNSLSTKDKELTKLLNQIKTAVEECAQSNKEKSMKVEDIKEQNKCLIDQIDSITEELQNLGDVKTENEILKNNIRTLEEDIRLSETNMKAREESVNALETQVEQLKQISSDLKNETDRIENDLENLKIQKDELLLKLEKDNQMFHQLRENNTMRNKKLEESNLALLSQKNKCESDLEEIEKFTLELNAREKEMREMIEHYSKNVEESKEKLITAKEEMNCMLEKHKEETNLIHEEIEKYKTVLDEAKPYQDELPLLLESKKNLQKLIKEDEEKHIEESNILQNNFSSKIMEMEKEIEKYTSIMQSLITAEEEVTEKLKLDNKDIEKENMKLEDSVRDEKKKLDILKQEEQKKRNKIARLEKRLQKIDKEVRVTHQDIADAVHGKSQEVTKKRNFNTFIQQEQTILNTLPSSNIQKQQYPPNKKTALKNIYSILPCNLNQAKVVQDGGSSTWVESVPYDEYDFSNI